MNANRLYVRHRFPAEIISHCVWLYYRFALSYRDVEELMTERGVTVSYERIRKWCQKLGRVYAKPPKGRAARPGDQRFLDEIFVRIQGSSSTSGVW